MQELDADGDNKSSTTVTTTSITVNIKQTSVKASEPIDEVVSTVAEAATAAITSASAKLDVDKNPPKSNSPSDVEMEDLTADVEMRDAPITSTATEKATSAVDAAANSVAVAVVADEPPPPPPVTCSQNEQKIDDVEKNISNLFNGEENAVSDEANATPKNGNGIAANDTAAGANSLISTVKNTCENGKNGTTESSEISAPSSDNATKSTVSDSNDLVSILTDDNPEITAKMSSTPSSTTDAKDVVAANAKTVAPIENKLVASVAKNATSTPTSSTGQTVYNSTPIQKQFEISSENVSTISDSATDIEPGLGDKSMRQEIISSHSSTTNKSSDISSGTVTGE